MSKKKTTRKPVAPVQIDLLITEDKTGISVDYRSADPRAKALVHTIVEALAAHLGGEAELY